MDPIWTMYGHIQNIDDIHDIIRLKRLAFNKHIQFYNNTDINLQPLIQQINDHSLFYTDIKKYVLYSFNIMAFPKICHQLYASRELIQPSRYSVLELLIDNLSEKFEVFKNDSFANI